VALLQAREVIRDVQTAAQMRERIPDWPWHRVDISEFKKAINEEDGDEDDRDEEDHCGEGVEHSYVKGSKEVSASAEASKTTLPLPNSPMTLPLPRVAPDNKREANEDPGIEELGRGKRTRSTIPFDEKYGQTN